MAKPLERVSKNYRLLQLIVWNMHAGIEDGSSALGQGK